MEAIQVASPDEERIRAAEEEQTQPPVAKTGTAQRMFRYSEFVHVGEGAAECELAETGECEDPRHFHAWCRLPNVYQAQDIRQKGLAAKARKLRELRDPDSDASVIVDNQLAEVNDPLFRETLIDELVGREWAEDYLEAQKDVDEREEFEHIGQDREELRRLNDIEGAKPEDEQSSEYKQLTKHFDTYVEAIRVRLLEIQAPKRAEYESRDIEALVALTRAQRVEEEADRAFMDVYTAWTWFVGTYRTKRHETLGRPYLLMWEEIGRKDLPTPGTMFSESPEVIDAVRKAFSDLQAALQAGSPGNS